jgi:hypothetical protein
MPDHGITSTDGRPTEDRLGGPHGRVLSTGTSVASHTDYEDGTRRYRHADGSEMTSARAGSPGPPPPARRLTVDLDRRTLTLDGVEYDVSSQSALQWVQVLADRPGEWVSSSDLPKLTNNELLDKRTDRYKRHLPEQVLALLDSETGAGSRIRL